MNRVQLEISLGLIFILISSGLLFQYASKEEERMLTLAAAEQAQAIEVGAGLFENNCSGCHGKQGQGIPGLCPPLNDRNFFTNRMSEIGWGGTLEDYVIATVSSGRPVSTRPDQYVGGGKPAMPSWSDQFGGPLRADQIRDIAKFVMNWEATALEQVVLETVAVPGETSDDPVVRGQAIYLAGACIGCHTLGALSNGQVGPVLTNVGTDAIAEAEKTGQTVEEWMRESIINPNAVVAANCPTGPCAPNIMPQNSGEIYTEEQINDLVAFLLAQK